MSSSIMLSIPIEFIPHLPSVIGNGFPTHHYFPNNTMKEFCCIITYQAIKNSICATMWQRFVDLVEHQLNTTTWQLNTPWQPEIIASLTDDQLCGYVRLSYRKANAVRNTAHYLATFGTPDLSKPSAELVNHMCQHVSFVGPFTIKEYLLGAGKLDIATTEDVSMRSGLALLYHLSTRPTLKQAHDLVHEKKWGQYASLGSIICFHINNQNQQSKLNRKF